MKEIMVKEILRYSIEVYENHAIIRGSITYDILKVLLKLSKKEGFTHLAHSDEGDGFKLIREK